jgi:hypothetical protein
MLRLTVSRPACLGVKPHLGLETRFLLLSDCCGFVDVSLLKVKVKVTLFVYLAVTMQLTL